MQVQGVEFIFDEVFHRFDIMVGDFLRVFDFLGIFYREVQVDFPQLGEKAGVESFQLGQRHLAQGNEVFDFHHDPVTDQGTFRKIVGQIFHFVSVSSVYRRNGC